MPAVEITKDGIFVGVAVHPATAMFPTIDSEGVAELAKDISRNGLKHPVVVTPNQQLLEGRGRWRACESLGLTPRKRVERSDPWLYLLRRNRPYLDTLSPQARVMIVGHAPRWGRPGRPKNATNYDDPPTIAALAQASGAPVNAIGRAQLIHATGVQSLRDLVAADHCPLYTGVRVAELPPDEQKIFVERVLNGANPRLIAPMEKKTEDQRRDRSRATTTDDFTFVRGRNRYLRLHTIRTLINTLDSTRMLVEQAEGLDPAVSPDEAKALHAELTASHIAYRRVADALKNRKETK